MGKIINLIAGPRNLSTAIMYAFAQRDDCKVLDEPYYAYYLTEGAPDVAHPSHQEIIETMDPDHHKVTEQIKQLSEQSHVFVKGMAHHYLDNEPSYITPWTNVILIRHPKNLLASFSKVIENPSVDDIGIKKAAQLYSYLKKCGTTPIVIDSDELIKSPSTYFEQLCEVIGIPFTETMLHWKKGGIPEDGVWAPHWYGNVHKSTGFVKQKTSSQPMPERLQPILDEALPYYQQLKQYILKNNAHATDL